ncbi:MAG: magnesium transporter [Candidatus Micrarchaeota archaeon]|nr:magnesium transporter [Candidatus Micrarchaeota archaeon]
MFAFRQLPVNEQGFVLLNLSRHTQKDIMNRLKIDEIVKLAEYLDPDKTTDILQSLKNAKRKKIIERLDKDIKGKVEFLLRFNPKTAAGLMNIDYIEIEKGSTFRDVSKIIKKHEKRTGKFPTILVINDGFLVGELPGYVLALYKDDEKVDGHVKHVPTIRYDKDQKDIVRTFKKHPHDKIIVLDDSGSILGVIYSDDVLRIIQKHPADNLYDFAGVSDEEDVFDPPLKKVKYRYKWLIINLATAFIAASVVSLFQDTISAFVLLAVYMPIVAGMGGNAGTQTLAVFVRGIALKEIELSKAREVIGKEMTAGAINGAINGTLVAIIATLWNKSPLLGLIIAIAMMTNLVIAGFFGALIPLIMKRLGKDPASSATIFITTATDVCGFFVFLGLATLLL